MMEIFEDYIVFSVDNRKRIAFLSLNDDTKSFIYEVDWSFPVITRRRVFQDGDIVEREAYTEEPKPPAKEQDEPSVQLIAVSEAANWLGFTTSDKCLVLCKVDIENASATMKSRRRYLKAANSLRFSSEGKCVYMADKTGDVYEYPCEDPMQPTRWLLGHISQILDLQLNFALS